MTIIRVSGRLQSEHLDELKPQPGRGELLVQIYAAGVTSKELLWYPITHSKNGERRSHAVPGHEFSGVIAAVGEDIAGFDIGQEVYGMNDWFSTVVDAVLPLTRASEVYTGEVKRRRGCGKLVVAVVAQ